MNDDHPLDASPDPDPLVLQTIEAALAERPWVAADDPASLTGFATHLARAVPPADPTFQDTLLARLQDELAPVPAQPARHYYAAPRNGARRVPEPRPADPPVGRWGSLVAWVRQLGTRPPGMAPGAARIFTRSALVTALLLTVGLLAYATAPFVGQFSR